MEILQQAAVENTSGRGKDSPVPESVAKKICWGAILNIFWSIRYKPMAFLISIGISLLAFIPFVGILAVLAFWVWLGKNGNKWAWQNCHYKNEEEFHDIQKRWVKLTLLLIFLPLIIFGIIIGIILINMGLFLATPDISSESSQEPQGLKAKNYYYKEFNDIISKRGIPLSGDDGIVLAGEFYKDLKVPNKSRGNNIICWGKTCNYSAALAFSGNGRKFCDFEYTNIENNCTVTVDTNGLKNGPNEVGTIKNPKDRWRYVIGGDKVMYIEDFIKKMK